jgi:excisionase family DNA binding protein
MIESGPDGWSGIYSNTEAHVGKLTGPEIRSDASREPARLLLRPEEAARALGVSRARLYQMMAEGQITSIKVGRLRRIPLAELTKWVESALAEQSA